MTRHSYKRRYFRIKPKRPLISDISIVKFNSRDVNTKSAPVQILNISPGGLMFLSELNFPVDPSLILRFKIQNSNQTVYPDGYIVHKHRNKENKYEYGVCFVNVDNSIRNLLLSLLKKIIRYTGNYKLIQKFY